MGKKDSAGKVYFSNPERFSDLVNGFCFHGRQVVKAEDLSEWDSKTGNRTRDVVWKTAFGTAFAVIGEENQETVDYSLPFRIMESDMSDYRHQVSEICRRNRKLIREKNESVSDLSAGERMYRFTKEDSIIPVITIVLKYGGEWTGPENLTEMMDIDQIPAELLPFISDYRINVIELSKLENKDTEVFRTDLKQVFNVIRCSNDGEKLEELLNGNSEYNDMEPDAFDLMDSYADLRRYGIKKNENEGGKVDMGNAMQQIVEKYTVIGETRGIRIGEERGEERGLDKGIIIFIEDKLEDGVDRDIIKDKLIKRFDLKPESAEQYIERCEESQ